MEALFEPLRTFELRMPGWVIFGLGTVERIGVEAKHLNARRILVVTDQGVVKAGLADKVSQPLRNNGLDAELWSNVEPEPSLGCVEQLLEHVRKGRFDLLVGVGGGSSMDVAKAAAVLLNNSGDPEDYFAGGKKEFQNPGAPCITIPTTAGTGAEITWDAVIKDRSGMKAFFEHPYVRPTITIVDPMMSSGMPPALTATTGIDALAHAVESTLTRKTNPITQALALQSIRLVSANLRTAVFHGTDIEARYNMALATLTEAFSEMNAGDIEAHAVGHLIGSLYRIPHGMACGIALPYAMEHNIMVVPDRLSLIAEAMGEDTKRLTIRDAAYRSIIAVRELIEDIGLPTTLKEIGVKKEELPKLAEDMVTIPWIKVFFDFTFRMMTKKDATQLLERMWEGKIGRS
jgi:alcohol dehydrogenase class IV